MTPLAVQEANLRSILASCEAGLIQFGLPRQPSDEFGLKWRAQMLASENAVIRASAAMAAPSSPQVIRKITIKTVNRMKHELKRLKAWLP